MHTHKILVAFRMFCSFSRKTLSLWLKESLADKMIQMLWTIVNFSFVCTISSQIIRVARCFWITLYYFAVFESHCTIVCMNFALDLRLKQGIKKRRKSKITAEHHKWMGVISSLVVFWKYFHIGNHYIKSNWWFSINS